VCGAEEQREELGIDASFKATQGWLSAWIIELELVRATLEQREDGRFEDLKACCLGALDPLLGTPSQTFPFVRPGERAIHMAGHWNPPLMVSASLTLAAHEDLTEKPNGPRSILDPWLPGGSMPPVSEEKLVHSGVREARFRYRKRGAFTRVDGRPGVAGIAAGLLGVDSWPLAGTTV
jgi:hypothetical protein